MQYGEIGAASPARCIDPVTGKTIGLAERAQIKERRSSLKHGASPALRTIARAGRSGASASSLAENESIGMALGIALVARGDAVVTRTNRFILKRWAGKTVATAINWDDDRGQGEDRDRNKRVGLIEPTPLRPPKRDR
jgi:hypothetical protein